MIKMVPVGDMIAVNLCLLIFIFILFFLIKHVPFFVIKYTNISLDCLLLKV